MYTVPATPLITQRACLSDRLAVPDVEFVRRDTTQIKTPSSSPFVGVVPVTHRYSSKYNIK